MPTATLSLDIISFTHHQQHRRVVVGPAWFPFVVGIKRKSPHDWRPLVHVRSSPIATTTTSSSSTHEGHHHHQRKVGGPEREGAKEYCSFEIISNGYTSLPDKAITPHHGSATEGSPVAINNIGIKLPGFIPCPVISTMAEADWFVLLLATGETLNHSH